MRKPWGVVVVVVALAVVAATSCGGSGGADGEPLGEAGGAPASYTVRVVATHPHDDDAYTQGLVWAGDGALFESTGQRGESTVRRVDIASGDVVLSHDLDDEYFGEGLALVSGQLVQLTWQEETAFVYDASDLAVTGTFTYSGEGWGLCHDGEQLVMSDGSATLVFRDADTFEPTGEVDVTFRGQPLDDLNELECIGDRVLANVLGEDDLYEIDPATGGVTAVVDASSLYPEHDARRGEVLNGIAYDPGSGHYFLTGKNWPTLFEVTFEPVT